MTSRTVVEEHLPTVREFIEQIREIDDEDERSHELRRVRPLIRFLRAFYTTFLDETLGVRVKGFAYKDKRRVSRKLIREEDKAAGKGEDDPVRARLDLAAQFEDLADLLHGELEFGYSDADADYEAFHRDAFPRWLEGTVVWLRTSDGENDQGLATEVDELYDEYWDVVVRSY